MEKKTFYFENVKDDHTETVFRLVEERLANSGIRKLVLASTTGATAERALNYFKGKEVKLLVVPHQYDFMRKVNPFPPALVKTLREAGHEVHFGTMLFHTDKFFGSSIPTIMANLLRCFSQGVKVCFEIVLMATDAGLVTSGESVIAIAGTGLKADTAMVMQAASTQNLSKLRVNEILCKPLNRYAAEEEN
ncbi:MAG TPA: hypothetical protein VHR47_09425 [Bacillota bacterium]|nr:hypothetical protein [Bacillota bacterium]